MLTFAIANAPLLRWLRAGDSRGSSNPFPLVLCFGEREYFFFHPPSLRVFFLSDSRRHHSSTPRPFRHGPTPTPVFFHLSVLPSCQLFRIPFQAVFDLPKSCPSVYNPPLCFFWRDDHSVKPTPLLLFDFRTMSIHICICEICLSFFSFST